ncbi:hypothetical protein ACXR2T_07895 [Leucobacter sp. HY1910]
MSTPPMFDLDGFVQVSCSTADAILCGSRAPELGSGRGAAWGSIRPSSSLTDPDGEYGSPLVYTEWSFEKNDYVALREYQFPGDDRLCEHWVPGPGFDHQRFLRGNQPAEDEEPTETDRAPAEKPDGAK